MYCNRFIIVFTQIIHDKQTERNKENMFNLIVCPLKSTVCSAASGTQRLASGERARRVADGKRERRGMVELEDRQQREVEGTLLFHSRLM